ncbi:TetR/AcrR family transcriptional regulator [Amycolatopsis magusensis]|uniref:AcrR family transcriptional regulator n=1 Tax=Amycolatopsis magusensis TaxID=882444 RepID=A0ABS4PRR1_9PSEU|nr:TetR/AcrR family transcriptional regulator [Amycolatopsis magusensis]MBP2182104.1 AcrR family transcriptional regulator [Amycolatopsis magusensis]MDI5981585.1 TetR/AcrR family transcriptional regulator [Amycolatopsis magusensis]
MPYHHGDLRRTMLTAAVAAITESGPAAISLRDLARRAGVSNAAPAHHFGDKAGLLTALAAEGYDLLADALGEVREGGMIDLGVAYVRFALEHRAHFEVMFRPDFYRADDEALVAARTRAGDVLADGVAADPRTGPEQELARVAAWSLMHGYATLVLTGAVSHEEPVVTARSIAKFLFPGDQVVK